MAPDLMHISRDHKRLLAQLCEVIPDFDPGVPENLQRIFSLGLFALLMQVNARQPPCKTRLAAELTAAVREIIRTNEGQDLL